nr:hypothetical protein HmN_000227500 [Hymenolepis microstoma]
MARGDRQYQRGYVKSGLQRGKQARGLRSECLDAANHGNGRKSSGDMLARRMASACRLKHRNKSQSVKCAVTRLRGCELLQEKGERLRFILNNLLQNCPDCHLGCIGLQNDASPARSIVVAFESCCCFTEENADPASGILLKCFGSPLSKSMRGWRT